MTKFITLRLVTGEELVAVHKNPVTQGEHDASYVYQLGKTHAIVMDERGQGGFVPWPMFTTDEEISILRQHVVYAAAPKPNLLQVYQKQIGTILTPGAAGLLLP